MKVAIVHDDLMRRGGAEQVVLSMLKAYPSADLYTLCYNPELTYPEFRNYPIRTSWYNSVVKTEKAMKSLFFPVGLLCMKALSVKGYDMVLISNTYCAKYVALDAHATVFIYTYTPFRLAWNPTSYKEYTESKGIRRIVYNTLTYLLRKIDAKEAKKGTHFLSMTEETAERVRKAYKVNEVSIIHPPVKCDNFYVAEKSSNYYLIVSRLEFYKNVDLAIKAFNTLNYRLIIVGNGSKRVELKAMANKNIEFKSGLPKEEIADLYAHCKAFIFPQYEDYGITPLEANASGRPVIAYGAGGVLETMIPYTGLTDRFTSLFFDEQTETSLINAIKFFETLQPNTSFIRSHAEKFTEDHFVSNLKAFVSKKMPF